MYNKEILLLKGLKNGYLQFRDHDHPLAYSDGSVYCHRHVLSIQLDRWLVSGEHIHHIDANKLNNSISNLELLSASEHALKHNPKLVAASCPTCFIEFTPHNSKSIYCSELCAKSSKIKNPSLTKEILQELISKYSWVALGKMFGYSDVGIKKRAKSLGCVLPVRRKN